jgi:hypothetical protein
MTVKETINRMKELWTIPHRETRSDLTQPDLELCCSFADDPATAYELSEFEDNAPEQLIDFWRVSKFAKLFEDRQYGQWGLEILSPLDAIHETHVQRNNRPAQYRLSDLVVGQFLGDSDLLIVRADISEADFGKVIVARPIDPRSYWYVAADNFGEFLRIYLEHEGAKYWVERCRASGFRDGFVGELPGDGGQTG